MIFNIDVTEALDHLYLYVFIGGAVNTHARPSVIRLIHARHGRVPVLWIGFSLLI